MANYRHPFCQITLFTFSSLFRYPHALSLSDNLRHISPNVCLPSAEPSPTQRIRHLGFVGDFATLSYFAPRAPHMNIQLTASASARRVGDTLATMSALTYASTCALPYSTMGSTL